MTGAKDMVKDAQLRRSWATGEITSVDRGLPLFVTPQHFAWLSRPSRDRTYSDRAKEFALAEFDDANYIPRGHGEMRFSPSSIGEECERRALFNYAGAPKEPDSMASIDMMDGGSWEHLKWQMEGLSAPWLADAELWRTITVLGGKTLGAKIDGLCTDGSLFELKSVGGFKFTKIVSDNRVLPAHLLQTDAYARVFNIDTISVVYVNRDNKDFKEFRVKSTPEGQARLDAVLSSLGDWIDVDELPDMLDGCTKRAGFVYSHCPYRGICPDAGKVSTVGDLRR